MTSTPISAAEGKYSSFLVHTDTVSMPHSPLDLDDPSLHKQKRRRTSPRDHAVLEAAYQRNSKPDKQERTDIVSQVELGEKEVQIWFQNRRQNDRRKSKPLQPHELLAHFRNGVPTQAIQHISPGKEEKQPLSGEVSNAAAALEVTRPSSRSSSIHDLLNPSSSTASPVVRDNKSSRAIPTSVLPTPPSSFEHTPRAANTKVPDSASQPASATTRESLHTRKRSHEVMSEEAAGTLNAPPKPKPLTRSSSFVRLAMTVDGAVKVRTDNEPTPSPPKQRTLPPISLVKSREKFGRSQSAIESTFIFKDINPPIRKPGAAGFGRSRDARTWEFYCDRDSGDALSTQAEAERSGSAIGAINLIRSQTQRQKSQALSPNPRKQNTRRIQSDQRNAKPRLSRTMSSMARLQTLDVVSGHPDGKDKHANQARSPSGDSDKENWAPGTRTSHHDMRRTHPSAPRDSVLQENDASAITDVIVSTITSEQEEDRNTAGKEKTKTDDLDCIQGLLSLSQGAWR